jgi:hypothetical protein
MRILAGNTSNLRVFGRLGARRCRSHRIIPPIVGGIELAYAGMRDFPVSELAKYS